MVQTLKGTQPGSYLGTLPADVYAGRVTLSVRFATGEYLDDPGNLPEPRKLATLTLTPAFKGFAKLSDGSIVALAPLTYESDDGSFDFYCIDGSSPGINPAGWNWTASLTTELGSSTFVFQPSKDAVTVLGRSLPLGVASGVPVIQGPAGPQGPAGLQGPEGPQGPQGPAGADGTGGTTGGITQEVADTRYATLAQGSLAETAVQPGDLPSGVAPANVVLSSAAQGELTASWDAVPDAIGYTLTLDAQAPQSVSGTSYTWAGLAPSSEHTVAVHAVLGLPTPDAQASGAVLDPPVTPAIQTVILADNPDYYWPLDDDPGSATLKQLGALTTAAPASAIETPTLTGHSCLFADGDDCWSVGRDVLETTTMFTLEAIINGNPTTANQGAWFSHPNGFTAYYDSANGLGGQINTTDATDNFFFKNWYSAPDGGRHHVAICYNGNSVQIYLDGVASQYGPYTLKGALVAPDANGGTWIGAAAGVACGLEISDVALWQSALTPSQISNHASAALAG